MSTKLVAIRIDNDLLKYLKERAENENRTLSNMIISILSKEMKPEDQEQADLCFVVYPHSPVKICCNNCQYELTSRVERCPKCNRIINWG